MTHDTIDPCLSCDGWGKRLSGPSNLCIDCEATGRRRERGSALVLLSGGLDSAACAALARRRHPRVDALTFRYGQAHEIEVDAADHLVDALELDHHHVVQLDTGTIRGPLSAGEELPAEGRDGLSSAYMPARNTVFLAHALAIAEAEGHVFIYFGANADDRDGFPDCHPNFFAAWEVLADFATGPRCQVKFRTPLIDRDKRAIVELALDLGVPVARTWSCYRPTDDRLPCGVCDACVLREQALHARAGHRSGPAFPGPREKRAHGVLFPVDSTGKAR